MKSKNMKILELFAGVGGFRIGLENANKAFFQTKWANQWEPSKKIQDAFECYNNHFADSQNINQDISTITDQSLSKIDADIIVGGFPCQDYSVARSLSGEKGITGKKGVLFWEIIRAAEQIQPTFLILENVDRLLKSPASQRGRDFAIMLSAFNNLNYSVEWRVINAAEYGMAQRRKRVFFFVYKNDCSLAKHCLMSDAENIIYKTGLFAKAFPIEKTPNKKRLDSGMLPTDLLEITNSYASPFYNSGIMRNGEYLTIDTIPTTIPPVLLKDILLDEILIDENYYLTENEIKKFKILRSAKKIKRISSTGHEYVFSEGGMSETDDLNKPGRTMLTSEGTQNRSTHIIKVNNRLRYLHPIECERLNGFPDDWTLGMSERMRYFCMGNALVTGIVQKIGVQLYSLIKELK